MKLGFCRVIETEARDREMLWKGSQKCERDRVGPRLGLAACLLGGLAHPM